MRRTLKVTGVIGIHSQAFTFPADITPPSIPDGLTQLINPGSIDFDWDDSTDDFDVDGYEIELSGSSDFSTTIFSGGASASNASSTKDARINKLDILVYFIGTIE